MYEAQEKMLNIILDRARNGLIDKEAQASALLEKTNSSILKKALEELKQKICCALLELRENIKLDREEKGN